MALLTPMSLEEAQAVGEEFGLVVERLSPVPHGSVNSNFELGLAGGGKAFLRLCEESDHDAVGAQNRLLAHLVTSGVPTPAPRERLDGKGTVARHAGKPVAVFGWCEGEWICQKRVTVGHVEQVGEVLGRIHRVGEGYAGAPINRFGFDALRGRLAGLAGQALSEELRRDVERLARAVDEVEPLVAGHPANTVVHGDVFRDNVLWTTEGPLAMSAMLDFESASMGHAAFDVMVTMLAWCFGDSFEEPLVQGLLAGYQRERPLREIDACFDEARAAAIRFAITRITDYELRPRGVVVYKDYRRFMRRLDAVEAIGRERFVSWLTG